MPDPKTPPNDKTKKARSFGSYALFILVLVAVLLWIGGNQFRQPALLTQDQFEYKLYTGEIDRQTFVGANEVEGELRGNGGPFKVLVPNRDDRAALYRQLKAQAAYHP